MTPEFHQAERAVDIKLVCIECGEKAEGNVYMEGEGEVCDNCHEKMTKPSCPDCNSLLSDESGGVVCNCKTCPRYRCWYAFGTYS